MSDYQQEVTNEGNVGARTKDPQNIREIVQQSRKKAEKDMKGRDPGDYDLNGLMYRFDVNSGFTDPIDEDLEAHLENEAA